MIICISIVSTECSSSQLFINPVSDESNSGKVRVLAAQPSDGVRSGAGEVDKLAVAEADNSYEDVLVSFLVGERSSTVPLQTQSYIWFQFSNEEFCEFYRKSATFSLTLDMVPKFSTELHLL